MKICFVMGVHLLIYLIIVLWIVCGIVPRHDNVITTLQRLLTTQPEHSTLAQQVDSFNHCLDSGCTFRLCQDASSILAETLGIFPWFLLVECLEA